MNAGLRSLAGGLLASILWMAGTSIGHAAAAVPDTLGPVLREQLIEAAQETPGFKNQFQARVWLLDMSTRLKQFVPNDRKRTKLLRQVHLEARRHHLNPQLVLSVIEVESHFKRFAISSSGARGLMQIMPFWKNVIGRHQDNLFTMATNLRYGCTILERYMQVEDGDRTRALARYNGSLGSLRYPTLVFDALSNNWATR